MDVAEPSPAGCARACCLCRGHKVATMCWPSLSSLAAHLYGGYKFVCMAGFTHARDEHVRKVRSGLGRCGWPLHALSVCLGIIMRACSIHQISSQLSAPSNQLTALEVDLLS
mmetsp:Transcript_69538/g.190865  ORF Transcript_69538/g.190865 Transcript_69538/m.190865 type:complete len:112 (-) Transcript_69538:54-389(-)